jgi:3-deoxy-D-manno-octulosonic-acid transferase
MNAYSFVVLVAGAVLKGLAPFSSKAQRFIKGRELTEERLRSIGKKNVVFFCSSAGEYEQALPVLRELEKIPEVKSLIIFFSQSGIDYVDSRRDTVEFVKAPLDTMGAWRAFFTAVQPEVSLIVRHEIWPIFAQEASERSSLILMNHSPSANLNSRFKRVLKRRLLSLFKRFYTVSAEGARQLREDLMIDDEKIAITGDTKYDRVMDRARDAARKGKERFEKISSPVPVQRRFILGSGWHKDIELTLDAYELLKARGESLQIVICPHDVSENMIEWIERTCSSRGFESMKFSTIEGQTVAEVSEILILDKMGILAEFYSWCGMAMVGGGLHHQVHNVLEPASHGLYTCIGPRYLNVHEAVDLVEQGLIQVCDEREKLFTWINERLHNQTRDEKLLSYLESKAGASKRIQIDLSDYLRLR